MLFKIKFLILLLIISLSASSYCGEKSASGSLQWNSFNTGLEKAKKEKKHIFVDFYADWCHWCKVMEAKTFTDKKVINILKKDYIAVRVDTEKKEPVTYKDLKLDTGKLASALGIKGLPSSAFLDEEGNIIDIIPGYIEADTFEGLLRYVRDGCYKMQVPFKDFIEKKTECK